MLCDRVRADVLSLDISKPAPSLLDRCPQALEDHPGLPPTPSPTSQNFRLISRQVLPHGDLGPQCPPWRPRKRRQRKERKLALLSGQPLFGSVGPQEWKWSVARTQDVCPLPGPLVSRSDIQPVPCPSLADFRKKCSLSHFSKIRPEESRAKEAI